MTYSDNDFFRVIGNISVYFATLDFFVSELIMRLIPITPNAIQQTPPFNERSTLGQKLRILQKMTHDDVVKPEILPQIHYVLPDAIEVSEERNRYIHDQWIFAPASISKGEIGRLKITIQKNWFPSFESSNHTIAELHEFLGKIDRLQKTFAEFVHALPQRTIEK